jgi:N-acetylneuraminic acid mutarotase
MAGLGAGVQAAGSPWTALAPVPEPRQAPAATAAGDGRVYLLGGTVGYTGPDHTGVQTARVDAYDLRANSWSPSAPLPKPRASFAAVTGKDGRIYAMGGYSIGDDRLNNLDVYDLKSNTWQALAPMPTARNGLAAVAGPDGRIYAIGGCSFYVSNSCNVLQTLEIYSPATNTWTTGAPMPTARASLAAGVGRDGRVYAIGGENESLQALNVVEAYDPGSNTWGPAAPMPTARSLLTAATGPDGRIYAIGGANNGVGPLAGALYGKIEIFDAGSGAWTVGKPMPRASHGLAAAAGSDGRIYVFAGANVFPIILDMAYAYDPAADTAVNPSQAPRCQFILGFLTLHDVDPVDVGECLADQSFAPNGDAVQGTTKGLLVWRKADNWTAFTDGYRTWVNGPGGLKQRLNSQRFPWEANPTGLPLVGA